MSNVKGHVGAMANTSATDDDEIDIMNIDPGDRNVLTELQNFKISISTCEDQELEQIADTDSEDESIDVVNVSPIKYIKSINERQENANVLTSTSEDIEQQSSNQIETDVVNFGLNNNLEVTTNVRKRKLGNKYKAIPMNGGKLKRKKIRTSNNSGEKISNENEENKSSKTQPTLFNFFTKINKSSLESERSATCSTKSYSDNDISSVKSKEKKKSEISQIFYNKTEGTVDVKRLANVKVILERINVDDYLAINKKTLSKKSSKKIDESNRSPASVNEQKSQTTRDKTTLQPNMTDAVPSTEYILQYCSECNKKWKSKCRKNAKCPTCTTKNIAFECAICDHRCAKYLGIYKHVNCKHFEKKWAKTPTKTVSSPKRKKKSTYKSSTGITTYLIECCPKCDKRIEITEQKCESCLVHVKFKCLLCKKQYDNKRNASRHVKENHEADLNNLGKLYELNKDLFKLIVISCKQCNESYDHTSEKTLFECSKCKISMIFTCQKCKSQINSLPSTIRHIKYECKGFPIMFYCNDCNFQHRHKYKLEYHIKDKHGDTGMTLYKCSRCQQTYKGKYNMTKHKSTCGIPPHLICKFCPYRIKYVPQIRKHVKLYHMDLINSTEECKDIINEIIIKGNKLRDKANKSIRDGTRTLMKPSRSFYATKLIERYCSKCDKAYKPDGEGYKYSKTCPSCETPFLYRCTKCPKIDKSYNVMYNHTTISCYPKEVFTCDICNFTTTAKATLRSHILSKHVDVDPKDYHVCTVCNKSFKILSNLRGHKRYCSKDEWFKCDKCTYKTKHKSNFGAHMQNHILSQNGKDAAADSGVEDTNPDSSKEKSITVKSLNKKTTLSRSASKGTSKMINTLKCPACNKVCIHRKALRKHRKNTCKERDVQCDYCPFKTKTKACVRAHIETMHLDANPVECPTCNRIFKNDRCLRSHQWYCGKEPRLNCAHCDYKTHTKYTLTKHVQLKHVKLFTDRVLKCSVCNIEIMNIYRLEQHVKQCRNNYRSMID